MRVLVGTDAGLSQVNAQTRDVLLADPIDALVVDGGDWLAIAEGQRVVRAGTELGRLRGLTARCVLAGGDGVLVGTSEAHLVRVAEGSAQRVPSFDRVPSRDTWYTPWGGPPDTRSLSRGAGGEVYANVHVGGILRSDDGRSWRTTAMDVDADVHQVLAHPTEPGVAFAATAIGLATTRDGGDSWEFTDDGLHAAYCRAVAVAGDVLLLSASRSHTGRDAALYRRAIDGGSFERCIAGLPDWFGDNLDTYCLDARGSAAALGTSDGRVFVSSDAGATWSAAAEGLGAISCLALA